MGLGKPQMEYLTDMWEYDPVVDAWRQTEEFPGSPRCNTRAFVIGSVAYLVTGYGGEYEKDMWMFSPKE